MDFILDHSCTIRKHDLILVVVDRFFKMIYIILYSKSSDISHIAYLFCREVVPLHVFLN